MKTRKANRVRVIEAVRIQSRTPAAYLELRVEWKMGYSVELGEDGADSGGAALAEVVRLGHVLLRCDSNVLALQRVLPHHPGSNQSHDIGMAAKTTDLKTFLLGSP